MHKSEISTPEKRCLNKVGGIILNTLYLNKATNHIRQIPKEFKWIVQYMQNIYVFLRLKI
jgi:hypothetical protein